MEWDSVEVVIPDFKPKLKPLKQKRIYIIIMVQELTEEFRMVQGFPNYQVSNMGRVMRVKTKRILKPQDDGNGYVHVSLNEAG